MSTQEILSSSELDALMDTFSDSPESNSGAAGSSDCIPFDFSKRGQALMAQLPTLKLMGDKQAMMLGKQMQSFLGLPMHISVEDIHLQKLDQAFDEISFPGAINVLQMTPLAGVSYLTIPARVIYFIVNAYFGGSPVGLDLKSERASLTPTELRINEVVCGQFLATLAEAWAGTAQITPHQIGLEKNSESLRADSPDEQALKFIFNLDSGDWTGTMTWIVPFAVLEPLQAKLSNAQGTTLTPNRCSQWETHFHRELQQVLVEVVGTFGCGPISISDVLNLRPGSILPLKKPGTVSVTLENEPVYLGELGVLNGNKSIKITKVIKQSPQLNQATELAP